LAQSVTLLATVWEEVNDVKGFPVTFFQKRAHPIEGSCARIVRVGQAHEPENQLLFAACGFALGVRYEREAASGKGST
jgi:hypothetical protein